MDLDTLLFLISLVASSLITIVVVDLDLVLERGVRNFFSNISISFTIKKKESLTQISIKMIFHQSTFGFRFPTEAVIIIDIIVIVDVPMFDIIHWLLLDDWLDHYITDVLCTVVNMVLIDALDAGVDVDARVRIVLSSWIKIFKVVADLTVGSAEIMEY